MSTTSVGEIGLDLVINQKQYDKQLASITKLAKKAGTMLAAAFSVKKLVDFGKECINLGSDLSEVQNVVDVTFTSMSDKVNEFAQSAAATYGLSETMAKRYTGTFGAMVKAFGFTESAAYDMSTTLTGLAGDVASFYNITQDEAYTKLKSVFTGETESLKDLGVVMTQTALDEYALANGFGKVTAKMSEAEKVALRYAFVQDQLSTATGDFARTSSSWANQVKILKLQVESFMSSVGQGLINLFTPVIQTINTLMSKLVSLGNTFKSFTEMITGKSIDSNGVDGLTESATSAQSAVSGIGESVEQTAKKMKALMGFDKINKMSNEDDTSSDEGLSIPLENIGASKGVSKTEEKVSSSIGLIDTLKKKLNEISNWTGLNKLWKSKEINTWAKEVTNSVKRGFENISFGAKNIFGSFWTALDENEEVIQATVENILTVFSEAGMTIGTIFNDGWEIASKGFDDFTSENKEDIDKYFSGVIETTTLLANTVTDIFGGIFSSVESWWEEDGKRVWDEMVGIFFDLVGWVTKIWNDIIKPVIDNISNELSRLWAEHLKPLWDNLLDFFTSLWDLIKVLWDKWLKPIIDWIVEYIGPIVSSIASVIVNVVGSVFGAIIDVVSGIVKALKGVIDFVVGIFTGDWNKAWNGIKTFFTGIWNAIWGAIKGVINAIIGALNALWSGLYGTLRTIINGVGSVVEKFGSLIGQDWVFSIPANAPQIPYLAKGGYVEKNTPQLAMIGDNRHQGEIVAPEDKLREMAIQAVREAGSGNGITKDDIERIVNNAVLRIVAALYEMGFNLDGEQLAKAEKIIQQGVDRRYNVVTIG